MHRLIQSCGAVSALAWSAITGAQPGILAGPIPYNGHRYYVLETSSWAAAEAAAVALGGHLITVNDAAENRWVFDTLSPFVRGSNGLWLGLNDAEIEGRFVWSSGEPAAYTNWNPGEPNGGRFENYVHMYPVGHNEASLWNDNEINPGFEVYGTAEIRAACYPDCDTSTGPGNLDVFDFLCFGNRYDQGHPYACDCDTSTGPGDCNVFDFLCFQNAYSAGCP